MTPMRDGITTPAERARDAGNAAADHYDLPPLAFRDYFGRRTVERLALHPGAHVLDACAGSGAAAIPAAEIVGPTGSVLAVDSAERLLELADRKAAARQLAHFSTRAADMTSLADAAGSFDAVLCLFGLVFADDLVAQLKLLWSLLRPGGSLAVTVWGPHSFEPAASVFWNAVGRRRPELRAAFNPWDRIADPDSFRGLFTQAGIDTVDLDGEDLEHPLASPEDFWTIAMGSAFRWTIERLMPEDQAWLHEEITQRLAATSALRLHVLYAVARREPPAAAPPPAG